MYFGSNIWRSPLTMLTFIFECCNARLAKKTQTWNIQMQQLNQQWSHEKAYLCTWVYVLLFTCGSIAFEPFIYFWKFGSSWHLCNQYRFNTSSILLWLIPLCQVNMARNVEARVCGDMDKKQTVKTTSQGVLVPVEKIFPTSKLKPTCPWLSWSEGRSSPPLSPSSCPTGCLLPALNFSTFSLN